MDCATTGIRRFGGVPTQIPRDRPRQPDRHAFAGECTLIIMIMGIKTHLATHRTLCSSRMQRYAPLLPNACVAESTSGLARPTAAMQP